MSKKRQTRPPRNRFGLVRDPPDSLKREVRQRCGFGCVIDGSALFTYEHFNPPYKDAKAHDPAGITLLCGSCQTKTSRGQLSKRTIAEADADPCPRRKGYAFEFFDVGPNQPAIVMGSVQLLCEYALVIDDTAILAARPPEEAGGPFRLSATLCDETGREMLRIRDNEWRTPTSSWDVETIGQRTTIRNKSRDIALVLRMEPRERLVVERLRMFFKGSLVTCDEKNGLFVEHVGHIEQVMHLHNMALKGPRIGIYCPLTDEGLRAARAGQAPKVIY